MKRSTDRILTTHCGSLARPNDLLLMIQAKVAGQPYDEAAFDARVRSAVAESVAHQAQLGIDVVNDGEQGKDSFVAYIGNRLTGLEPAAEQSFTTTMMRRSKEIETFREYYEEYYFKPRSANRIAGALQMVCTGPVSYKGQDAVHADIANLKAGLAGLAVEEAFLPASAPRGMAGNRYYRTFEEYIFAVADAMHEEYKAITDAGFLLQIDDPALTVAYGRDTEMAGETYVEAINHALRGIPAEQVRFHTCYGINEGPRVYDTPLADVLPLMYKINACAYSFEAANPRHEHEWRAFKDVRLPEGKVIIPGVITHTTNVVEHPRLVADRIIKYAEVVGRENVIAGADCGFCSEARFHPDVHPTVVWAKFEALVEGARIATKELWRR